MKLKITYILILIYISNFSLHSQINPTAMVAKMGRGINLGNVLSAPVEGNWAPAVQESYFDDISLVGFKSVRIPIRFDTNTTPFSSVVYKDGNGNYIGNISDYTVSASYLNRIEQVVDWALSKGLVAIIDVHGDHWYWESYKVSSPEYKTGADLLAAEDRFKAIWTAIATRFQNKSENLLFEIMNEPYFSMSAAQANNTTLFILPIIRATNPTRNVIITSGGKNSFETPTQISDAVLNSDSHLIPTFHYYHPRAFTASSEEAHTDNDWGTQADKDDVIADFTVAKNWAASKNVPMYLGEFGADNENGYDYFTNTPGSFGGPDAYSRESFHRFLANLAISFGFSFTVWDSGDKAGKTIYKQKNRDWVIDVRNAVLNTQCSSSGIIDNADVECNYDYVWGLTTQNGAVATRNNALTTESYTNSKTIKIAVSSAGINPESIILNNKTATTGFAIGDNYNFKCFAKGNNNQTFNIRIKAVINGMTEYQTSPALTLSTVYQVFALPYNVKPNTTSLEFQVLCGQQTGDYYFDNFSTSSVVTGNYYYDGSGSLSDLTNWGSNVNGTGANPLNFTDDAQTFTIRNTTTVTTTASWAVSGANSKIIVGDASQAGLSLTVANTFAITGTIDIAVANSGINTVILQNTTTPTFGILDSNSEVHLQAAGTYTFTGTPTFGKLFIDGGNTVSLGLGVQNIETALNVALGSSLNLNFNTSSWMYINTGATATINGTVKSPKTAGIFSYGVTSPGISFASIQFADAAPSLILGSDSTVEYSRSAGSSNSSQVISVLPTGVSYSNLSLSETPQSFSTAKTIAGPITVTGVLTINQSTNSGSSFATGGNLTLKSTASRTAVVAPVIGTISGNVIVERFIPSGFRAYRLLSTSTTGGTIKANWQENQNDGANLNPGFGTHITGAGAAANGFDTTTSHSPSLYTHNNTGAPASWTAVANTSSILDAGSSYLIYLRGSRQTSNISSTTNDATTLRATGTLKTGTTTISGLNTTANGFSLIGNPYQAQVDMQAVLATSTNLNKSFYYVLEPKMGSKGQYVTVNLGTNTNTGGSTANRYLQPWQGCFVQTIASPTATPSLSFAEINKYNGSPQTSVFRTANALSSLKITLFDTAVLAQNGYPVDGLVVDFNLSESNEVDQNDAVKLTNYDENMATSNSGKLLSFERRAIPVETDVIPLTITNYTVSNYTMKINTTSLTGEKPYLEDSFTTTRTEIPMDGNLNYAFSVDIAIPASMAAERFKIIYAKTLGVNQENYNSNDVTIYKEKGIFYVNSGTVALDNIKIFDIQGILIREQKYINATTFAIKDLGVGHQVLIAKITTVDGKVVNKKVIN